MTSAARSALAAFLVVEQRAESPQSVGLGIPIALALGRGVRGFVVRAVEQYAAQIGHVPLDGVGRLLPRFPVGAQLGHLRDDVFVDGRSRFGRCGVIHGHLRACARFRPHAE